jgi:hypothetical protein
LRDLR